MDLESSTMPVPDNCTPSSRPIVPPKPKTKDEKESSGSGRLSTKSNVGTQVHFVLKTSPTGRKTTQENNSSPINGSKTPGEGGLSPNNVKVVEVFKGEEGQSRSLSSTAKPALPPKPTASSLVSPRRGTNIPIPSQDSKNGKTPTNHSDSKTPDIPFHSRPPFSIIDISDLNNSNNPACKQQTEENSNSSSVIQPVTNLNQSQRLISKRLPQVRTVQSQSLSLTEAQISEARRKTTSLGRNFDFSSSVLGRNSTPQFVRVSPLDLSSTKSRPRSMDLFGRTISFAPNSPLPPPPPPRIKRKFSSTSPSTAPLPESPPPTSPLPVYAKVDKERKWEMRRLKKELEATAYKVDSLALIGSVQVNESANVQNQSEEFDNSKVSDCADADSSHDEVSESQSPVNNKSWLGKFLKTTEDSLDNCLAVCKDKQVKSGPNSLEQIQNLINPFTKYENKSGVFDDDEELTPTDEKLPENNSFLFLHLEKNPDLKEISSIFDPEIGNFQVNQDSSTTDDSFENICERKLESITQTTECNGNINSKLNLEIESSPKSLGRNQNSLVPELLVLNIEDGQLLESVDYKIQSLQSLLSTISNRSSICSVGQGELTMENLGSHSHSSEFGSSTSHFTTGSEGSATEIEYTNRTDKSTDADLVNQIVSQKFTPHHRLETSANGKVENTNSESILANEVAPHLLSRATFRRRSWTCSENTSSLSDSSPSSSSSSIRERSGSITRTSGWIDAGEISTGALGDTENSDVSTQVANPSSLRPYPGSGGSLSRRKRTTVGSIFSSFGKSIGSSSGSNSPCGSKPKRKEKFKLFSTDIRPSPKKIQTYRAPTDGIISTTAGPLSHWSAGPSGSPQLIPTPPKKTVSMPQFNHPSNDDFYQEKHTTASNPQYRTQSHGLIIKSTTVADDDEGEKAEVAKISSNHSAYDDILADLSQKEKKTFYVARELLTSERTFVDVLNLLTIDFPQALKEASVAIRQPVISDADLQLILGELPTLKKVNIILLNDLEERILGWKSSPKMADIIVRTGPFLKHYSTYIRDFEKISRFFGECRQRNMKFSKTVMDFEGSLRCQKLCLMHYMLKPVQRMPQYRLLLEDYLKTLSPESPDYQDTMKAITIVREVAEHANDAITLQVNADKLIQLQNRLNHCVILKPDRLLIKEGELQKVCRKELQPRYFALMNESLLCMMYNASTGSNRDLKLRYELPLTGMQVLLSPSDDYPNEFTIISTTRSFNLLARSAKEREEWMKAINLVIRENIKRRSYSTPDIDKEFELGKVAPVWIQDTRVTMCQMCTSEFTITFRRHHCRACGKVVCSNCSRNEAPLHYQNLESARVCDDCYQFLQEEFDRENQQNHSDEVENIRARFKKQTPKVARTPRRSIPTRLEINSTVGAQVSGYLNWRERKSWKRRWFVLADRVLLVCAASEDIVASKSIPILGYDVEVGTDKTYDVVDGHLVFRLTHSGQSPMIFQAENNSSLEKWVEAMKEATVLS